MLFTLLTIATVGVIGVIGAMSSTSTYGSDLEQYIVDQNPQNIYDVERLAKEYDNKISQGFL
jgi:hypothetical protein